MAVDYTKLLLTLRSNHEKIYTQGSQALSIANPNATAQHDVTHDLSGYPRVRVWYEDGNGNITEAVGDGAPTLGVSSSAAFSEHQCSYYLYPNLIRIIFNRWVTVGTTRNTVVYWRIYLDED